MLADLIDKRVQCRRRPSWWAALIAAPWFLGAVLGVYGAIVDSVVAQRERTVLGILVTHEVANHNQYRYRFVVNGTSYLGLGHPPSELAKVGDQILVYYDPEEPARNALVDFADAEIEALGPVPLCLVGVGVVAFLIWWQRRKSSSGSVN